MLSHQGRSFTFNRSADGYQRGEHSLTFVSFSQEAKTFRIPCFLRIGFQRKHVPQNWRKSSSQNCCRRRLWCSFRQDVSRQGWHFNKTDRGSTHSLFGKSMLGAARLHRVNAKPIDQWIGFSWYQEPPWVKCFPTKDVCHDLFNFEPLKIANEGPTNFALWNSRNPAAYQNFTRTCMHWLETLRSFLKVHTNHSVFVSVLMSYS